jgi:hypothetical protein
MEDLIKIVTMKRMRTLTVFLAALLSIASPSWAGTPPPASYYNYANNEAEYSVMLPEAPTVKTIWKEDLNDYPFIDAPPHEASFLGEVAIFRQDDIDSEDTFTAKVTYLKARPEFLQGLTEDKIRLILDSRTKDKALEYQAFHYSPGNGTLKWASLSGFTLDKSRRPAYSTIHYLSGQQSILVIEIFYSVENKTFQDYYKTLVDNIRYNAP